MYEKALIYIMHLFQRKLIEEMILTWIQNEIALKLDDTLETLITKLFKNVWIWNGKNHN